jgi:hypothetical protein
MTHVEPFLLMKWYLDCVSNEGTAFIGYAAQLQMKKLVLHYSSILLRDKSSEIFSDTSLRQGRFPQIDRSRISWENDSLSFNGEWNAIAPPIERTWTPEEKGTITWSCFQPMGRAKVQIGNDRCIEGLGYVEQLTQTIPPWKLPFKELRWGHLLSESDAIVWIDWKGDTQTSLVLKNGLEVPGCTIGDDEIRGDQCDFRLSFDQKAVLRNGPLVSTALSMIPGISLLLPSDILHIHETKWLSSGTLARDPLSPTTGWVIHEVVKFQ